MHDDNQARKFTVVTRLSLLRIYSDGKVHNVLDKNQEYGCNEKNRENQCIRNGQYSGSETDPTQLSRLKKENLFLFVDTVK